MFLLGSIHGKSPNFTTVALTVVTNTTFLPSKQKTVGNLPGKIECSSSDEAQDEVMGC